MAARFLLYALAFVLAGTGARAQITGAVQKTLDTGWSFLRIDQDSIALEYFNQALESARGQKDTLGIAEALLDIGICQYGNSLVVGQQYANDALSAFESVKQSHPQAAMTGRAKVLQLMATIQGRQKNWDACIALSKEARAAFNPGDSNGYVGLACNSIGAAFLAMQKPDSAYFYFKEALTDFSISHNLTYLPAANYNIGRVLVMKHQYPEALSCYQEALRLAVATGNHQASVAARLYMAQLFREDLPDFAKASAYLDTALDEAQRLHDKSFLLQVMAEKAISYEQQGQYLQALRWTQQKNALADSLFNIEKHRQLTQLEIQFRINEQELSLQRAKSAQLHTHYLNQLWMILCGILLLIVAAVIIIYKRLTRQKQLLIDTQQNLIKTRDESLKVKEALIQARETEHELRQRQLQNEVEHKEAQLGALTLQMIKKTELIEEFRQWADANKHAHEGDFMKIINKSTLQDSEWDKFNQYFEAVNRNFYDKIKAQFPDISPNDLKLCALIRMNLSIKEMAAILGISADSVKTARYRLRKKLQLSTEDNLAAFVLSI